jgi:hypothetical protein
LIGTFGRLPEIEEELNKLLEQTSHDLSRLPKPPSSEPLGEMMRLIGSFVRSIERLVDGSPDDNGLMQALRRPHSEFKKAIRHTAPDFRPRPRGEKKSTIPLAPPSFLVDEETDWQDQLNGTNTAIYIEDVMKKANL